MLELMVVMLVDGSELMESTVLIALMTGFDELLMVG